MSEKRWNAPRICVVCELKYIPIRAHQLACGETCSRLHKNQQEKLKYRSVSPKTCVVCKKTFEADRKAKTCSKECSTAWRNRYKKKKYPPKNCVVCGVEFYAHQRAITCSPECCLESKKERARRGLYLKNRPPQPCETCGEMFKPKTLSHKFCRPKCWASRPKKPAVIVSCLHCGEEYTKTKKHQKYCSPTCAEAVNKIRLDRLNAEARKGREKKTVKCQSCNFYFKQKNSRQRFCSASCNAEFYREKGLRETDRSPIRPKVCLHCKEKFTPRTRKSMAKFCSHKCRGGHQAAKRQVKIEELQKEKANFEKLQRKFDDSSIQVKDCPVETGFAKEIWAYLKKGKTITRYINPVWAAGSIIDEDEVELFEI